MSQSESRVPSRWDGVKRVYTKSDVERLRGSIKIEHTLAKLGAERLWQLLHTEPFVPALGALTGAQAVQSVAGGGFSCMFFLQIQDRLKLWTVLRRGIHTPTVDLLASQTSQARIRIFRETRITSEVRVLYVLWHVGDMMLEKILQG